MATVVNTGAGTGTADTTATNSMVYTVGIILLIAFLFLMFMYGLPLMRGVGTNQPQINVPDKMSIDVNQK